MRRNEVERLLKTNGIKVIDEDFGYTLLKEDHFYVDIKVYGADLGVLIKSIDIITAHDLELINEFVHTVKTRLKHSLDIQNKRKDKAERVNTAKILFSKGISTQDIADRLGVTDITVKAYIRGYQHD